MNKNSVKKSKISKKRRNNAILYPIYKMVSWDLLCFYSVEFLFYTITKGVTASQVLLITASYMLGKLFFQIPSVAIADYLGKRKSLIIGNAILIAYMILNFILLWLYSYCTEYCRERWYKDIFQRPPEYWFYRQTRKAKASKQYSIVRL